jgi:uracil-DNA glycosylase
MNGWDKVFSLDDVEQIYADVCNRCQFMPYPFFDELLKAFELTPFDEVKVVILGQDPYHGSYSVPTTPPTRGMKLVPQANGLAFSVDKGVKLPPSLKNIFKELKDDLGIDNKHGDLSGWAKQGVLLLNSVLTVEPGSAGSHAGMGWEAITTDVIDALTKRKDPVMFLLWGKKAEETFLNAVDPDTPLYLMKAAHPSPFSAHHGFFGCKHFSKVNKWLEKNGKTPIDWKLDE